MPVDMIYYLRDSFVARTVGAAVERPVRLNAVANNLTATVMTDRRQFMYRALETVEHVAHAGGDDFE